VRHSLTNYLIAFELFTTYPAILNTRPLAALVAITQTALLARSLRAGNSNLWCRHHWRMSLPAPLYHKLYVALTF